MKIEKTTFSVLEGGHPTLNIASTKLHEGKWVVDGTMNVTLAAARGFYEPAVSGGKGLSVNLPFVGAEDEKGAVQQAAKELLQIAEKLKEVAETLLAQS